MGREEVEGIIVRTERNNRVAVEVQALKESALIL